MGKILENISIILIDNNTRCMVEYQQMNNDEVQAKLTELQQKGWTLASIARELGQAIRTVESWNQGKRSPANLQSVLASLDVLLKRKRIPKKKQYNKAGQEMEAIKMEKNVKLEEEKRKIEEQISELKLQISKANNASDKDDKLSWTRDDEIEALYKEIEKKQTRLKEINKALGR